MIRLTIRCSDPSHEVEEVEKEYILDDEMSGLTDFLIFGEWLVFTGPSVSLVLPLPVDERNGWKVRVEIDGQRLPRRMKRR